MIMLAKYVCGPFDPLAWHVDPPPRDVREAPVPNPNGDKKS